MAVREVAANPRSGASAPSDSTASGSWFCRENLPWEECASYLPSERAALGSFLRQLSRTRAPPAGEFEGEGIVMSGGPMHVLQALANLRVLRRHLGSRMRAEFWHAFEVSKAHCAALRELGAECRALRVPGVYPQWQTVLPAILASGFRHVFWLDTDVTPLVAPERLFSSRAYRDTGALFWPDHWGRSCSLWGATARPDHVVWHLLNITHNASESRCVAEHEAGHLLVDKDRHWHPLCLANYLASRDFFTRVMHGYKDVFRMAWLKLGSSDWLSPIRPGLIGLADASTKQFVGPHMVHFWPPDDEFGPGHEGLPVPLYIHQRKRPGRVWAELLTFRNLPLGECAPRRIMQDVFRINEDNMLLWSLQIQQPDLLADLRAVEEEWELGWRQAKERFIADPSLSPAELAEVLEAERAPSVSPTELAALLALERRQRFSSGSNCSWAYGALADAGMVGSWDLTYSNGYGPLVYHIGDAGEVKVDGPIDGLGFGQLCRAPALGSSWTFGLSENELVFILYGVHRAGKWEIIRRSGRGQLELTHRVGRRSVCCLAEGRLRGVP